jgi:DNA-binding GntR family transcriptional regulator
MKDADEVLAIADGLRQYLLDHPAACDTEEGIAAWWLPGRLGLSRDDVRSALRILELEGLVRRVVRQDGEALFARRL